MRAGERIDGERLAGLIPAPAFALLQIAARQAQQQGRDIYLVGGGVRDLLLGRRTTDIDLMLTGDATGFARELAGRYGGRVEVHPTFGTAKWLLDDAAIVDDVEDAPGHIDFAMARRECYAKPAALPTVSPGRVADDLARRDFSINALALRLSADSSQATLLDPHDGGEDIQRGLIRVLHDGSFIDDPTRIFRAFKFVARFDFTLEPQTDRLMREALPGIDGLSGERIRHEIDLILREPRPERIIAALHESGVLRHTHPAFAYSDRLSLLFRSVRSERPPWHDALLDPNTALLAAAF